MAATAAAAAAAAAPMAATAAAAAAVTAWGCLARLRPAPGSVLQRRQLRARAFLRTTGSRVLPRAASRMAPGAASSPSALVAARPPGRGGGASMKLDAADSKAGGGRWHGGAGQSSHPDPGKDAWQVWLKGTQGRGG
eukprot:scaffold19571_cov50-Phaeocystis_antarctica.AAC.2